ncbi:solute carrier family 22 member 18-like [Diadema antillarum]|uniref:solute carrier family 22 member 18-like n=1 Tax=Diadema antillarum TaxID=105358 RepID=UPI003A8B0B56
MISYPKPTSDENNRNSKNQNAAAAGESDPLPPEQPGQSSPGDRGGASALANAFTREETRQEQTHSVPRSDKKKLPRANMEHSGQSRGTQVRAHNTRINVELVKTVLLINAFLYAVCFWIQVGVLPYLTRKLGIDMVTFGYLQTFFSLAALIGGPIFGRFGDVYGGRAALALAYTSAAAVYGTLSIATNTALVFLSRVPSLFLHSFHGTQMVIADLTNDAGRTEALGKVSMFYSIGIVVGPLIGGWVSVYTSEQSAAAVACLGSCVSIALVLLFIPAITKPPQPAQPQSDRSSGSLFSIQKFASLVRSSPSAAFFLVVNIIAGLPGAILHSMFAIIIMEKFQLTSDQNGYFLSFQGVISIIVQGFVIGELTKRFSEMRLLRGSAVVLAFSYLGLTMVQDAWQLAGVMLPMNCGNCIVGTVITSVLTKSVPASESGTILGLSHAGLSLLGTVAPIVGAQLLTHFGFPSLGVVGAAVNLVLLMVLTRY